MVLYFWRRWEARESHGIILISFKYINVLYLDMSNLDQTLQKITKDIYDLPVEHFYLVNNDGKILFTVTENKERNVWAGSKLNKIKPDILSESVAIHNHPIHYWVGTIPVLSSFSVEDLYTAYGYNLTGCIAVDLFYIYSMKRPKFGYSKITNREFTKYYWDTHDKMKREWRKQVIDGEITLRYFEENFQHFLVKNVCNHFGWNYSRVKNSYSNFEMKLKGDIMQYADIPKWVKTSKSPNKKNVIDLYKRNFISAMQKKFRIKKIL